MTARMSLNVPIERGDQLAALAHDLNLNLGEAIGALLDYAARTGFGGSLTLPGTEVVAKGDHVEIALSGFALRPLTAAQAESFAAELRQTATTPGAAILDLDLPDTIEISRKGAGVVLSVRTGASEGPNYDKRPVYAFQRVFACGVAKALADRIDDAAKQVTGVAELLAGLDGL